MSSCSRRCSQQCKACTPTAPWAGSFVVGTSSILALPTPIRCASPRDMQILNEDQVRARVSLAQAIDVVREAFIALAAGKALMPAPIEIDFPHTHADFHVK